MIPAGAIDCDIHPAVPGTRALLPYLDDYWREHILRRGIERDNLETSAYPGRGADQCAAGLAAAAGPAGVSLAALQRMSSTRCSRASPSATCCTARR